MKQADDIHASSFLASFDREKSLGCNLESGEKSLLLEAPSLHSFPQTQQDLFPN